MKTVGYFYVTVLRKQISIDCAIHVMEMTLCVLYRTGELRFKGESDRKILMQTAIKGEKTEA